MSHSRPDLCCRNVLTLSRYLLRFSLLNQVFTGQMAVHGLIATQSSHKAEAFGVEVSVPSNSIARLQYYLHSVGTCIPEFELKELITNYKSYYTLSEEDKTAVVLFATILSPDEFIGKLIFPVEENSRVLNGRSNEFYKLTETKTLTGVVGDQKLEGVVVVQGKQVNVSKIMVFSENWIVRNFIEPMKAEAWRIQKMVDAIKKKEAAKKKESCVIL